MDHMDEMKQSRVLGDGKNWSCTLKPIFPRDMNPMFPFGGWIWDICAYQCSQRNFVIYARSHLEDDSLLFRVINYSRYGLNSDSADFYFDFPPGTANADLKHRVYVTFKDTPKETPDLDEFCLWIAQCNRVMIHQFRDHNS